MAGGAHRHVVLVPHLLRERARSTIDGATPCTYVSRGAAVLNHRTRPAEILLVEDNAGDIRLIREALRDGKLQNRLNVVNDGEAALAFLRRQAPYAEAPRPDLILLDL